MKKPKIGQVVYWTDPDDGISSGFYVVFNAGLDTSDISNGHSTAEVMNHEIRPATSSECFKSVMIG